MTVLEVHDKQTKALFHKVLNTIYADVANYVFPLEVDIDIVFDQQKNPAFDNGNAKRWVLINAENEPIGRISAFYSHVYQKNKSHPIGGFGYFECIKNIKASALLFNTAINWLRSKGLKGMEGPLNFGEKEKFWGLLTHGFTEPTYLASYNPSYYSALFDAFEFRPANEQNTYKIDRQSFDAKRFSKIAEWINRKPGLRFENFKSSEIERFAKDFTTIYNNAGNNHLTFGPLNEKQVISYFKAMRSFLVEDFIWFCYVQNQPAGVVAIMPDLNQLIKGMEGKLTMLNKLMLRHFNNFRKITKTKDLIFHVVPEYRKYGVETVLLYKFYKAVSQTWQYNSVELGIGTISNKRMVALLENLNAQKVKTHRTFRITF
ncbi:MAG: hypothetical protein JXQ87_11050 [Bacteroidia bacterium]